MTSVFQRAEAVVRALKQEPDLLVQVASMLWLARVAGPWTASAPVDHESGLFRYGTDGHLAAFVPVSDKDDSVVHWVCHGTGASGRAMSIHDALTTLDNRLVTDDWLLAGPSPEHIRIALPWVVPGGDEEMYRPAVLPGDRTQRAVTLVRETFHGKLWNATKGWYLWPTPDSPDPPQPLAEPLLGRSAQHAADELLRRNGWLLIGR